ncbi:hypothetical protein V2J09_008736 [Rumex salicifolius]
MPEYCVTGATGFIAAHLVKTLLLKGYTVRATVRDPGNLEKVGFLWDLQGAKQRLKLIKADLLEEGSFDDAVNGVNGVFHTASPVAIPPFGDNVQETLINPAIKGTVNVLKSCVKAKVQRVVLTSSSSATRYRDDIHQICPLNESHWSDIDYCKRYKLWYAYSKTLAEKEAWKIANENGLDLVVVIPSFVVGPFLSPQPTSSIEILLSVIRGTRGGILDQVIGFVHIDDVISAHVLAMEESKATGRLSTNQQGDANRHSNDMSKLVELGLNGFKTIPEIAYAYLIKFAMIAVQSNLFAQQTQTCQWWSII